MKVRVYFCKEPDIQAVIIKQDKISRQALDTIYDLVWESEFKNILNVGRIWLKFKEQQDKNKPFGIPLREKKSHEGLLSSLSRFRFPTDGLIFTILLLICVK
jgi:hypothetical protein